MHGQQSGHIIEPWLTISSGKSAIDFYKKAFGATETYRFEDPSGGIVVRLETEGAGFWVSIEGAEGEGKPAIPLGGDNVKMILITREPEGLFEQALKADATEVFPVGEDHGWKLGRLADPYGMHWEIGCPLG